MWLQIEGTIQGYFIEWKINLIKLLRKSIENLQIFSPPTKTPNHGCFREKKSKLHVQVSCVKADIFQTVMSSNLTRSLLKLCTYGTKSMIKILFKITYSGNLRNVVDLNKHA